LAKLVRSRRIEGIRVGFVNIGCIAWRGIQIDAQIGCRRMGYLFMQLVVHLGNCQGDACFDAGIDAAMLGFDTATARQQVFVFDDLSRLLMTFAHGLDQQKVLRVYENSHILRAHR